MAMNIILWVVLGGIAGWIASLVTDSDRGILGDIILGILGAIIGGWIVELVGGYLDLHPWNLRTSRGGAGAARQLGSQPWMFQKPTTSSSKT